MRSRRSLDAPFVDLLASKLQQDQTGLTILYNSNLYQYSAAAAFEILISDKLHTERHLNMPGQKGVPAGTCNVMQI